MSNSTQRRAPIGLLLLGGVGLLALLILRKPKEEPSTPPGEWSIVIGEEHHAV